MYGGMICAALLSAYSAVADDAQTERLQRQIDVLQQQLQVLQRQVAETKRTVVTRPPPPPPPPVGPFVKAPPLPPPAGVTLKVGGFIEAAGIWRQRNENADQGTDFNTGIPLPNSPLYHENEFRGTARHSRISLLATGDIDPV